MVEVGRVRERPGRFDVSAERVHCSEWVSEGRGREGGTNVDGAYVIVLRWVAVRLDDDAMHKGGEVAVGHLRLLCGSSVVCPRQKEGE